MSARATSNPPPGPPEGPDAVRPMQGGGLSPSAGQPEDLTRLLEAASKGDPAAWRGLVGLYSRRVFALAKSRVKREDVAEEITQSVFVTVAAKLSTGQYAERGRFEAWLFRVAMNRVRDEIRRRRTRAETTDPQAINQSVAAPGTDRPTEPRPDTRAIQGLRAAVAALSDSDREIVELRHHAGMSFKHIAALLGEPLGTVLARHHRALRKLKEAIGTFSPGFDGAES